MILQPIQPPENCRASTLRHESFWDESGDGSNEGLTFAFDDDEPTEGASFMPPENDKDRLAYREDVFESSPISVVEFAILHGRIEINGAEIRLLDSMKRLIKPVLASSSRLVQKKR
jgi:hypothetical protein